MTQEKELLFKDLSARLPYQPLCKKIDTEDDFCEYDVLLGYSLRDLINNKIIIKPYLRPMSSMTEEEIGEYKCLNDALDENYEVHIDNAYPAFDWLNAHHFDYRGLIKKGLAIEVTENNNPYKD